MHSDSSQGVVLEIMTSNNESYNACS